MSSDAIYFTLADPFDQRLAKINYRRFIASLNADLILFDKVVVSGSHILGSDLTSYALLFVDEGRELLQEGLVTVCLPNECANSSEYLTKFVNFHRDQRFYQKLDLHMTRYEYYSYYAHMYAYPSLVKPEKLKHDPEGLLAYRAHCLDEISPSFLKYKISEAWNIVSKSLMNDFDYYNSPFKRFVRSSEEFKKLKEVTEFVLTEHGTLNRPLIVRFIEQLTASRRQLYLKIINLAYYLGGLNAISSLKLHCRQPYFDLIKQKMSYDILHLKRSGVQFFTRAALKSFLELHGLNLADLAILDIDSLKSIRKSSAARKFKTKFFRLINNWLEGKIYEEDIMDIERLELELTQTIRSEIDKEYKWLRVKEGIEPIHMSLRIMGTTISGLSSLFSLLQANYAAGVISIASGGVLLASGPILDLIIRNKSNFIAFGELLKKKIKPAT
jgi:hypothetical protein